MKKKYNSQITMVLYVLIIAFVAICATRKVLPNDIFFTIPCGQNILDNGFSTADTLTYHTGLNFIDVRWVFDVIMTIIHNAFSWDGIYISTIVFSILLFESIFVTLNKLYKKSNISFIITLISAIFIHVYIVPRAQILSALIFVWEYYCIIQLLRSNKKRYYISLILLAIAIVNVHATLYPIFLLLFLPYITEFIISKLNISNKFKKITFDNSKYYKNLIILFFIILLMGFVSPYSGTAYTVMFKTMSGKTNRTINEMQLLFGTILLYMWFSYILIFSVLGAFKTHLKASNIFLIAGLSIMAIYANRGFLIFVIITNFPLCEILVSCYNSRYYFIFKEKIPKLDFILKFIYCLICLTILVKSLLYLYDNIFEYEYISDIYEPVYATEYLLNEINLDDYVLYNEFNYGSYLEYKGIKAFMDSRAEVFEKPYNDVEIMYDSNKMEFAQDYEELKPYIEKYHFNLFLVNKDFNLFNILMDNTEHSELLHLDDNFAIFKLVEK